MYVPITKDLFHLRNSYMRNSMVIQDDKAGRHGSIAKCTKSLRLQMISLNVSWCEFRAATTLDNGAIKGFWRKPEVIINIGCFPCGAKWPEPLPDLVTSLQNIINDHVTNSIKKNTWSLSSQVLPYTVYSSTFLLNLVQCPKWSLRHPETNAETGEKVQLLSWQVTPVSAQQEVSISSG